MPPWQSMAASSDCLPPLHYTIASPATAVKLLSELGAPFLLPGLAVPQRDPIEYPSPSKNLWHLILGLARWSLSEWSDGRSPLLSPRPVASEFPWVCSNTVPILEAVLTRVTGRSNATLSEMNIAVLCLCALESTLHFERAQVLQKGAMQRSTAIDLGSLACIITSTAATHF